ncbi:MAG: transcription antitermination factor NusB [Lachnospiraceae bacterium]|nr:transcription antitermination factor NusB [Candidatus Colinaster scatohippi]
MTRRGLREQIFKLLFRIEFNDADEMDEQMSLFFETSDEEFTEEESDYVQKKYESIVAHLDDIDKSINERAKGWTTDRMSKVDLTIIRLGVYEIVFDDDIPASVAVNEAVELAKLFGQDESYSFVNGVLAKFV